MSSEDPTPAPGVNPLVRWFVVGLPLGLLIMGALSFVIYFQKRHAKEAAASAPSRYASMLRRDLNPDDYRRYIRIFEQEIGPRTSDKPENIEAAQSFIESTLGFGNMGYHVLRKELGLNGEKIVDFEVELPGTKNPDALVLVVAPYDGVDAKAVSALMCLAHSLTGMKFRNTVRFIALVAGGPKENARGDSTNSGSISYLESLPRGVTGATVVVGSDPRITLLGERTNFPAPDAGNDDVIKTLSSCREAILRLAEARLLK